MNSSRSSTTVVFAPKSDNSMAVRRPTGPAPTISTLQDEHALFVAWVGNEAELEDFLGKFEELEYGMFEELGAESRDLSFDDSSVFNFLCGIGSELGK